MLPLNSNDPYIDDNGTRSRLGDVIGSGGGGGYTLPTASSDTKGGVKIGDGLTMTGEVLSADEQIPSYGVAQAGKLLVVNNSGSLEWGTVNVPVTYAKTDISNPAGNVAVKVEEVI